MAKGKPPVTQAVRVLKASNVGYKSHLYKYEEHGGTAAFARQLQVDEHVVIKTLVMEDDNRNPLIVLMHGDREVSTKNLARAIGAKSVVPCTPQVAQKHSGYQVGGTSPFATMKELPVYIETSILERLGIGGALDKATV